jgi:hypothetical protein
MYIRRFRKVSYPHPSFLPLFQQVARVTSPLFDFRNISRPPSPLSVIQENLRDFIWFRPATLHYSMYSSQQYTYKQASYQTSS